MCNDDAAVRSCLASNTAWRRQARHLREHALSFACSIGQQPHLTDQQRAILLREADAADRQADMWLNGAIELG